MENNKKLPKKTESLPSVPDEKVTSLWNRQAEGATSSKLVRKLFGSAAKRGLPQRLAADTKWQVESV